MSQLCTSRRLNFRRTSSMMEDFGWLTNANISHFWEDIHDTLPLWTLHIYSVHLCVFSSPLFVAWEHLVGPEELIHPFLWRLSSFLMNWKEALNVVGDCSSVYTHTFPLGLLIVAATKSISKAYVSQPRPRCQVPSNSWGCPLCEKNFREETGNMFDLLWGAR